MVCYLRVESLIYQLIYKINMQKFIQGKKQSSFERSPTLETVMMVEKTIEENSGEFSRTKLWKLLPRKVMWQTFLVILDYLGSINKIAVDKKGKIAYIWNPSLTKKLRLRKEIKL